MFDDITDGSNRQQAICDKIKIEDIFIGDNYLFDSGDEQDIKIICDFVLSNIDSNNILFENVLAKVEEEPLIFLLPDKRRKKQAKSFLISIKTTPKKAMLKRASKDAKRS